MKKILVILGSVIVLLSSCAKEEDLSKTELLCNSDWKVSGWTIAFTYNGVSQTLDIYENPELIGVPECLFDDLINFDIDGTYSTKPGANICDASLIGSGDWEFKANEAVLSITFYGDTVNTDYNILTLNESVCSISTIQSIDVTTSTKSIGLAPGEIIDATFTYTFKH